MDRFAKSIKRRRASQKGHRTRLNNRYARQQAAESLLPSLSETIEVRDRKILRTAKDIYIENEARNGNSTVKKTEIIDFNQASYELLGQKNIEARLDAGESIETRKAFYTLHSSSPRTITKADAMDESAKRMSSVINMAKRAR